MLNKFIQTSLLFSVTDTNVSQNLSEIFDEAFGVYQYHFCIQQPAHELVTYIIKP
jgi:hypothetical protein